MRMTKAERELMRSVNRANSREYHYSRKWRNIEAIAAPLRAVRRKLR